MYINDFSTYLKNRFGKKIYKISLDAGMTCPNRDGRLDTRGCIFCSEGGSGDFASSCKLSITEQISQGKNRVSKKIADDKGSGQYIAYFQAYTNTYAPIDHLRRIYTEALNEPDIVALSIGTRCDCLSEDVLDLLEGLMYTEFPSIVDGVYTKSRKPIWIELGLQTIHNATHARLNTHTKVELFDTAVANLYNRTIPVIAHVILGLPGETYKMMLETVSHVAALRLSGIKLQLLHILKGTKLADEYITEPFPLFELEEYCDFIIDCLEILPPDMVIHRLTGDGPRSLLIAPLWSTDKKRVLNTINKRLNERDTFQGRLYGKNEN